MFRNAIIRKPNLIAFSIILSVFLRFRAHTAAYAYVRPFSFAAPRFFDNYSHPSAWRQQICYNEHIKNKGLRSDEFCFMERQRPKSRAQKNFSEVFEKLDADFFCIQETKLQEGQVELDLPGYHQYWNYAERKGYSGTAIFTKHEPQSVSYGIKNSEFDHEGRVITLEYASFILSAATRRIRSQNSNALIFGWALKMPS